MKKDLIALFIIAIIVQGCAMLDLDGNGRVDPLAYLESADITVAWVGEDGTAYSVALDELGKQMLGQFVQAKTGYLFEVSDEGGVTVTDPNGVRIQIKRKE